MYNVFVNTKKKKIIFKKQLLKYPYFYKILKNNLKIVLKNRFKNFQHSFHEPHLFLQQRRF